MNLLFENLRVVCVAEVANESQICQLMVNHLQLDFFPQGKIMFYCNFKAQFVPRKNTQSVVFHAVFLLPSNAHCVY